MEWARILAYITGSVDEELRLRNEYLAAENRILRAQVKVRLLLSDVERKTLADIGYRLGRRALEDVANVAKPETILGGYRKLVARKFDGSEARRYPGRPRVGREVEDLVVRLAKENLGWGYDRIVGALANLGYALSDETVGNILRRNDIPPAPKRKQTTTWKEFIRAHMYVLAGTDFFTVEVLTLRDLQGKGVTSRSLPPRRTVRESLPSLRSSLSRASCLTRFLWPRIPLNGQPHASATAPVHTNGLTFRERCRRAK